MSKVEGETLASWVANLLLAGSIVAAPFASAGGADNTTNAGTPKLPILIELFTSEGCSSCPPADTFLEKLDSVQPVPGAELIVLSEHVDYWNHDGWKDPFSSSFFSDRQGVYGHRFDLKSVYTPEMVVDGTAQFLGNDVHAAEKALTDAVKSPKIAVHLSGISIDAGDTLHAHIEAAPLPDSSTSKEADVYVAVVFHRGESDILKGENAGHHLAYTNVVRSLKQIGVVRRGEGFSQDASLKMDATPNGNKDLRFIAFVQDQHQGKVLGATIEAISTNP